MVDRIEYKTIVCVYVWMYVYVCMYVCMYVWQLNTLRSGERILPGSIDLIRCFLQRAGLNGANIIHHMTGHTRAHIERDSVSSSSPRVGQHEFFLQLAIMVCVCVCVCVLRYVCVHEHMYVCVYERT